MGSEQRGPGFLTSAFSSDQKDQNGGKTKLWAFECWTVSLTFLPGAMAGLEGSAQTCVSGEICGRLVEGERLETECLQGDDQGSPTEMGRASEHRALTEDRGATLFVLMCLRGSSWSSATADAQLQALLSGGFLTQLGASLVTQTVKNPPSMQETQVQFLGQEDPQEKGMATHSSILTWEIPWTEEPGGYSPGVSKSQTHLTLSTFTVLPKFLLLSLSAHSM